MKKLATLITVICSLMNVFSQEGNKDDLPIEIISKDEKNIIILSGDATPLIRAVKIGNLKAVKILVENGADINQGSKGDGSPLIEAAKLGHMPIVKYLVEQKANVNIHVVGDETPLIRAAWNGHLNIVKYLVEHGADVNMTVREGGYRLGNEKRNALRMAKKGKHKDVIAYLISKGAKQ